MGTPRGVITAESLEEEIKAAGAEMRECKTLEELRVLWLKCFPRIGHKALARMFVTGGVNADVVAQRAVAAHLRMGGQ